MWRVIKISLPLNLRDLLVYHCHVTYLQKLHVTMRVVKSAFNEAIALKRKRDTNRSGLRECKTHFPVYYLKTSRLIVQALI